MKTSEILFRAMAVAVAVTVFFSCTKVEESDTVVPVTFGASFNEVLPKTVLDQSGFKVLWEGTDKIAVSGAVTPFVIEPEIAEPAATVNFVGEAEVADIYYGAYPYSALEAWNGSVASMTLKQIQPAENGTFASDMNIAVSSTDAKTKNFQFHNVLGYLKFTIGENTGEVTELIVSSIGGEKLTGSFAVDCSSEEPAVIADAEAYTSAAISSDTPLAPGDYYIAMFPGVYKQGLKFIVNGPDGVAVKDINQELELGRGRVNTLGTIDVTNWTRSVERKTGISVMSFNVRSSALDNADEGEHTLWTNRKSPVTAMISDVRPDILGLQEVVKDPQLADMNAVLSNDYAYYVHTPSGVGAVGESFKASMFNVIMYRKAVFELADEGYQYFTDNGDYGEVPSSEAWGYCTDNSRRFFQWVKLIHKISGETVWVFNTHLPVNNSTKTDNNPDGDNSAARAICLRKMVEKAVSLCGDDSAVYFTGDFNSAYSRADAFVLDVATQWLYDARTEAEDKDNWRSINNWTRLEQDGTASVDHIFYRNVAPVQYKTIISDRYGLRFLSDHYAINFRSVLTWNVPVAAVFDAYFVEGFDISGLEAGFDEGFADEDDYGNGNMEGFGPEDSFEFI